MDVKGGGITYGVPGIAPELPSPELPGIAPELPFDLPITLGIAVGSEAIRPPHLNEAINYRMLDRQLWT